jgi:hypothetical protein
VFVKDPRALRVSRVNGRQEILSPLVDQPIADESTLVTASRSLETVRNFLSVHDLPFAIEVAREAGSIEVLWSDVRFCRQDRPAAAVGDCALWFGGLFDRDGRPLTQVTYVGKWRQERRVR